MNEIIISLISCAFTCIITIACFYIKQKYSRSKTSIDFLDLISKEKIKYFKLYVGRDKESETKSEFEYTSEGSSSIRSLSSESINLDIILRDGENLTQEEMKKITKYFKIDKGGK